MKTKNKDARVWLQKDEKKIQVIVDFFDNIVTERYLFDYRKGEYPKSYEMDALLELRIVNAYSNGAINVLFNYCLKNNIETNYSNISKILESWYKQLNYIDKISTRHALQLIREYDESIKKN